MLNLSAFALVLVLDYRANKLAGLHCPIRSLFPTFRPNIVAMRPLAKSNHHDNHVQSFINWLLVLAIVVQFAIHLQDNHQVQATILMRVCDTREIKTVTNRVCMLYKRTKNSDVKVDSQGNLRIARGAKGEHSPEKLAQDCCKIGCPPHIFADNC